MHGRSRLRSWRGGRYRVSWPVLFAYPVAEQRMTYGMWRATGMSTDALHSTFEKAGKEIACADCWTILRARIQEVCWQWSQVKVRAFNCPNPDDVHVELIHRGVCRGRYETRSGVSDDG